MNQQENRDRFESLIQKVRRDGMDDLFDYIRKSDFYTAPASTRFRMSTEGGLLQHSLNVYDCLQDKAQHSRIWQPLLSKAGEDALIICPLLHDLCKTHFYKIDYKNQKTYDAKKVAAAERWQVKRDNGGSFIWEQVSYYTVDDKVPYGHGEKSVMMIEQFMKLTGPERFAIRWHMGFTEPRESYNQIKAAIEQYPLVLALHEADQEASAIFEGETDNKDLVHEYKREEPAGCDFQEVEGKDM